MTSPQAEQRELQEKTAKQMRARIAANQYFMKGLIQQNFKYGSTFSQEKLALGQGQCRSFVSSNNSKQLAESPWSTALIKSSGSCGQ